jgi:hypothetical protein
MSDLQQVWLVDSERALKRRVRIEVIGKSFALYEQLWRSEAYFFDDLVYLGKQGESHVFGLEDGLKARPKWRLGFKGELPADQAAADIEHRHVDHSFSVSGDRLFRSQLTNGAQAQPGIRPLNNIPATEGAEPMNVRQRTFSSIVFEV